MKEQTNAIVLNCTKYGENSVVLHALTREYGRKSFMVKGLGRKTSSSLLLPMNILEAEVILGRKAGALATASRLSTKHGLMGIRSSISKNAITMFMSEVLYRVVKDGTGEASLYDMCEESILLLDALENDFSNFHIWFLLKFIVELGFSPEIKDLEPFLREHTDLVRNFVSATLAEAMLVPLNGQARGEIAARLLKYIEFHTESAVNVNSLNVLAELFRC